MSNLFEKETDAQVSVSNNSQFTFDDNNDRLLDNTYGKLFRYSELDQKIYDLRSFSPTDDIPLQTKTVTPTEDKQILVPDAGFYGFDKTIVKPIPANYADITKVTATADDVAKGKKIVNSEGELVEGVIETVSFRDETLDVNRSSYTYSSGIYNGSHTVSINLSSEEIEPKMIEQVVTPISGDVLEKVIVKKIPITRSLNSAGGYTIQIG